MHRRTVALLLATCAAGAGCGSEEDNRPLELAYLTEAIFAPACGATQCHSTFRQAEGLVFDTVDGVRRSLHTSDNGEPWLRFDYERPDPQYPFGSRLYVLISETVPFPGSDTPRMPLDAPLPNKDIELLRLWIKDPASGSPFGVGGGGLGAQCDPDRNPGHLACDDTRVVTCDDDWNFGDTVEVCPLGCNADCAVDDCTPQSMCRQP